MPINVVPWPATEPTAYLPFWILSFLTSLFPAISCYICVASTFFMQSDIISNYSLSNCPDIHSSLPPVSYSIGVWEPQKLFWLFALFINFPPHVLLIAMYPQIWLPGLGRTLIYWSTSIELAALICVTIFHVDSIIGFHAHAGFFVVWWIASITGMGLSVHLQRITGLRDSEPFYMKTFCLKLLIIFLFVLSSAGVTMLYPLSQIKCSIVAFTIFCICEYSVIGLNGLFWYVCLYEFGREFKGFQIITIKRSKDSTRKYSISPTITPTSIIVDMPKY